MSLYHLMSNGPHPLAGLFINILGLAIESIPRLRDAHLVVVDGEPVVRILTRTGGGNREEYQEQNEMLQEHPGFRSDADSEFDTTYAEFFYDVPAVVREEALQLVPLLGDFPAYSVRFKTYLAQIEGKDSDWKPKPVTPAEAEEVQRIIETLIEKLTGDPA